MEDNADLWRKIGIEIGPFPVLLGPPPSPFVWGENISIGSHCVIDASAVLNSGVFVDHYCRLGERTTVGMNTQILYGAQIYAKCQIGIKSSMVVH